MAIPPANRLPRRVFLLAGEPSGDRIGADLMHRLKARDAFAFSGVGGSGMIAEGLSPLFPMSDLSVMGFADVIGRLPLLLWRLDQLKRRILAEKPDIAVLIDAQVFSALLAKRLRRAGFKAPVLLYVAPSVWAWKPERAAKLKPLFNEVLAVLPFEPEVMTKLDGPKTSYVGHPALGAAPPAPGGQRNLIALLPGSRTGEIRRHLPVFRDLVAALGAHPAVKGFVLPTLPHLAAHLMAETANWAAPVRIVTDIDARAEALAQTRMAVVTAGTITLELALSGIPMVGTYIPDKRLMHHYIKAGRPMIALPNIILGRRVIPEIAPGPSMLQKLQAKTLELIEDEKERADQIKAFGIMRALMEMGGEGAPREDPAERVLSYLA